MHCVKGVLQTMVKGVRQTQERGAANSGKGCGKLRKGVRHFWFPGVVFRGISKEMFPPGFPDLALFAELWVRQIGFSLERSL